MKQVRTQATGGKLSIVLNKREIIEAVKARYRHRFPLGAEVKINVSKKGWVSITMREP